MVRPGLAAVACAASPSCARYRADPRMSRCDCRDAMRRAARACEAASARRSESCSARARAPRRAVALAALPAGRVGEAPRRVGAVALVERVDLAGGLRDAREARALLADRAGGGDQRAADLLAPAAGLGDLREPERPCRAAFEPAPGEVQAGLRIDVGLGLRDRAVLDLVVDDLGHRLGLLAGVAQHLEVQEALHGPIDLGDGELELALHGDRAAEA